MAFPLNVGWMLGGMHNEMGTCSAIVNVSKRLVEHGYFVDFKQQRFVKV